MPQAQIEQGSYVGPYRIDAMLGRGGMGQVFRAYDAKLNRSVAIKFLADDLADPDARRRFQREAQTVSSLNHPHILTVHDVGELDGRQYLVTEFVDGGTLVDWAGAETRTWRQIVAVMAGVADGLASAHAAGILHRDIKPQNILMAKTGYAKLADFGLAKLDATLGPAATAALTMHPTHSGVVLGTVAYMSPEQAAGSPLDARSDIFSFGIVLYELLAGERPFAGASDVQLMGAIMSGTPKPLSADVPYTLRLIVEKALEKDPADRYQTMREMVVDLKRAGRATHPVAERAQPETRRRPVQPWAIVLSAVAALFLIGAIVVWQLRRADYWWSNPLVNARFTPLTDFPGTEGDAAISRDGKFVTFLSDQDGPFDVWVGQVGTGSFYNLTKGQIADMRNPEVRSLGFSPDGSLISFWVRAPERTTVWTVPTMGGTTRSYLDAPELDWSPDGRRMVYHTSADGDPLFVTEPDDKVGKQIYVAERGVHNHFPLWSTDGAFIYFVHGFPPDEMDIWRIRPTGGSPERMTFHNSRVAHLTFLNPRTLLYTSAEADGSGPWLYEIDVDRRVPHRISFGVERYTSIAATADGRRLVATVANPAAHIWRVPISSGIAEESAVRRITLPAFRGVSPRIGPNYMLYLSSKGGDDGIWKLANGAGVELWSGSLGRVLVGPAIEPNGRRIAFTARKSGRSRLYLMNSDGTSVTELAPSLNIRGAPSWPPVGEWLTVAADQGKDAGIFKVPLDGGPATPLVNEPGTNPVWSPDGRFVVYAGVEVGTRLALKAATADGKPYRIPELILSRGSSRFLFLPGQSVLVVLEGEFWLKNFWTVDLITGKRRQLTNFDREFLIHDFDVSPDGRDIIFGRLKESSNVILIDFPPRRRERSKDLARF